jgi:hypothetical protein
MSLSSEPSEKAHSFEIHVVYNGVSKAIRHVESQELVSALLQRALEEFGVRDRPHAYALYRLSGEEIPNDRTVHAAGIEKDAKLLLREKIVGGG